MKNFLYTLLLVAFNLGIIFLVLEGGYRIWLKINADSASIWSLRDSKENSEKIYVEPPVTLGRLIQKSSFHGRVYELMANIEAIYLGHPLRTNSFGMRGAEVGLDKPENVFRIAGIGDSVMFGWGVAEEDSYLKLLELDFESEKGKGHELRIAQDKLETLNFAVPGYNTSMEVATYESLGRRFSPDILVLHFVENDFGVPQFMSIPEDYSSLKKSFVKKEIKRIFRSYFPSSSGKVEAKSDLVGVEFRGTDTVSKKKVINQYQYMLGHQGFKKALGRLHELVCEDKVPVILLTGKLKDSYKRLILEETRKYNFHVAEVYTKVNDYIRENNIEDTPKSRRQLLWVSENDSHPNALGHRLYAKALREKIEEVLDMPVDQHFKSCIAQ
ncbi:MAG TPA: SGNH/GDSL hydrolase family protein [Oligoflexia bacterium]|nr:SGNH/GDSL hydrolase family protein [Oligoflexia bacterium]HMP49449.1 SGNH/GDSL hydrolase family protein [Oligoflexia bacterium]